MKGENDQISSILNHKLLWVILWHGLKKFEVEVKLVCYNDMQNIQNVNGKWGSGNDHQ